MIVWRKNEGFFLHVVVWLDSRACIKRTEDMQLTLTGHPRSTSLPNTQRYLIMTQSVLKMELSYLKARAFREHTPWPLQFLNCILPRFPI